MEHTINGVTGGLFEIVYNNGGKKGQIIDQKFTAVRHSKNGKCRVVMRFDDSCGNRHMDFSITGEFWYPEDIGKRECSTLGCIHDRIIEFFPEFKEFIKYHLVNTDEPWGYLANTLYLAGNRDCWGRKKGEGYMPKTFLTFDNDPIEHYQKSSGEKFIKFLQDDESGYDFETIQIDYDGKSDYSFSPNYTVGAFGESWYDAPFDSEEEALAFVEALQNHNPQFVTKFSRFSEGKEREFGAARTAGLHEFDKKLTDEILSLPKEELKKILLDRLPMIMKEFKKLMTKNCGFVWVDSERG